MTAPLRSGDPITVNVALGDRAYDIAIGRGLLATLGERIAKLRPGCKVAIVTDETVARHHLAAAEASLDRRRHRRLVRQGAGRREQQELSSCFERVCDALLRQGSSAAISSLRSAAAWSAISPASPRGRAARRRFRAGADDAAGAGRFLGRRQDRDQRPPGQEPGRRVLSAEPGARRHRRCSTRCRSASFAPAMPRWSNTACSATRSFFDWLEANWRDVFAGGPAREHAIAVSCRAKAAIVARDERETGDRALLNLGHTFGHALRGRGRLSPTGSLHGEAVALGMALAFEFSARRGLCPKAGRRPRHRASCGRSACPPMSKPSPAATARTSTP